MEVEANVEDNEQKIKMIRSIIGSEIPESEILDALLQKNNNLEGAINHLLDSSPPLTVHKTVTSTGVRISAPIKQENGEESLGCGFKVKEEPDVGIDEKWEKKVFDECGAKGSVGKWDLGCQMVNGLKVEEESDVGFEGKVQKEETKKGFNVRDLEKEYKEWLKLPENNPQIDTQKPKQEEKLEMVKFKEEPVLRVEPLSARPLSKQEYNRLNSSSSYRAIGGIKEKMGIEKNSLSVVVIEDGDFPEDSDWLLVGRTVVTGLSTTKGRKLENNEIIHFSFPQSEGSKHSSQWGGSRAAIAAASSIVRFSTKRSGEVNMNSIIMILVLLLSLILDVVC